MSIEVRRPGADALAPGRGTLVLVDTDPAVAAELMHAAAQIGIHTTWCSNGAEALLVVGADPPDVLVLASRTDAVDAAAITTAVRDRWELPILIGSTPDDDEVVRNALAAGASAVITRPYDIAAISPFATNTGSSSNIEPTVYVAGPIHINRHGYETRVRDRDVQLTQRELELLVFLIEQHGKVASSDEIGWAVWGHQPDTNTVAVHVKRLREKLGHDPQHGEFIRTIRGVGYRLAPSIYA